jgi:hypothetical protein
MRTSAKLRVLSQVKMMAGVVPAMDATPVSFCEHCGRVTRIRAFMRHPRDEENAPPAIPEADPPSASAEPVGDP